MEVTIKLLENAMQDALKRFNAEGWTNGQGRFLIDGFPRKMDQALKFEEDVHSSLLFCMIIAHEWLILRSACRPLPCSSQRRRRLC